VSRHGRHERAAEVPGLPEPESASVGQKILYHGARVGLLVALTAFITVLFPPSPRVDMGRYEVGMVASEDVIARIPFSVPKSPEVLARDRALAMGAVPPTLDYVAAAADSMAAGLSAFFDEVDQAAESGDRERLQQVLAAHSVRPTPRQVTRLLDPDVRRALRTAAMRSASGILPKGVVDAGQIDRTGTSTVTVRDGEKEKSVPAADLLSARDFYAAAAELLPTSSPPDVADLLRLILIRYLRYSYALNVVATERDRDAAARSVPTTKASVLEGQAIVRAADPIGPEQLEELNAYEAQLRSQGLLEDRGPWVGAVLGAALLNFLLLSVFGLMVFFFRREAYANLRWLILITLLSAVYFAAAAVIAGKHVPPEWLPVAFVALPVGILWDSRMALVLAMLLAAITGALPPFPEYSTVLAVIAGGAGAALSVRAVRRRSETWVSIAIISAATALVLFGYGLAHASDMGHVARGALYATGNATGSALLAMGFLWLFEQFTGITTDQTLLEWADPARPLLRRLSLEAPGTYAHSINVANLAEAAATAIGANGLLCRVGIYYHDIGKVLKPHYFVENQPAGRNPHDKLKPETSAAIVREHVTEGVRLAQDAKVPDGIIDFIREHHGTQRIGFFYQKALEEEGADAVDPARFQYPGPRPRSRETAIAMLADSCESATRALKDPTPDRVRDLVNNIVDAKIRDGQLDDAPLTLADIAVVKEQFVKILTSGMHRRIDYPETKHLTEAPEEEESGEAEAAPADDAHGEAVPGSGPRGDSGSDSGDPSGSDSASDSGSDSASDSGEDPRGGPRAP